MLFPKVDQAEHDDERAHADDDGVGGGGFEFGHVFEVHAVPARDQRQRQEDGGHDGQHGHHAILAQVHLGLIEVVELYGVFAQGVRGAHQPGIAIGDEVEVCLLYTSDAADEL